MKRIVTLTLLALVAIVASAQKKSFNVVFIGNSITYGALHEQRELTAPPAVCARWLSQQAGIDTVYFANCGRSGRTTYHFLPRKEDVIPAGDKTYFADVVAKATALVKQHPDAPLVFSIMLGTNDSAERPRNHRTTPQDYARNLTTIIDSLLNRWPQAHVVLQRVIYYTPGIHTKAGSLLDGESLAALKDYYRQYATVVKHCAKGHVHVGDKKAYGYFKRHHLTDVFRETGADGASYYLHPNERGAEQLARFWGKALLKVMRSSSCRASAGA